MMWDRLLFAIDQFESGQTALRFAAGVAEATQADVRVLHLRELPKWARVPPLETDAEAERLVAGAVLSLRLVGVGAEGRSRPGREDKVAVRIVEESMFWECDAIVLGSRRLHGFERLSGRGVRERVLRLSSLPVLVAPTPVINGFHSPERFRSHADDAKGVGPPPPERNS